MICDCYMYLGLAPTCERQLPPAFNIFFNFRILALRYVLHQNTGLFRSSFLDLTTLSNLTMYPPAFFRTNTANFGEIMEMWHDEYEIQRDNVLGPSTQACHQLVMHSLNDGLICSTFMIPYQFSLIFFPFLPLDIDATYVLAGKGGMRQTANILNCLCAYVSMS